ncbi:MAG: aminomethyltransferase beta-barrel domain-containing protein, partial [Verrucomicrobiota bacterium]
FDQPDAPGLYHRDFLMRDLSLPVDFLNEPQQILVMPRYRDPLQKATLEPLDNGEAKLRFEQPQRALAPGQVAAFYAGDRLLGGGLYADRLDG